jgi:8-amino-7-oxononanoate synthase
MNNSPIYKRISEALLKKKQAHLFRQCAQPENSWIDLSTNSYLSLQTNSKVIEAARKLAGENFHGNLASRVVSSGSPLFTELENEIASWKHAESALVFNTGYAANVGMLQAIASRSTTIFCDKLNHASIIDGILLSVAKIVRYRHGDMDDLKTKLAASVCKEKLIVTDSIFSMDGDCAPLVDICYLARTYDCMVMVDEAHATGVFGATGSGLVEELGLESSIDIRMGTLSKSIAGMGGYFAGPSLLRDYFINSSRSFIYSTALPHSVLAWDLTALRYVKTNAGMGSKLLTQARSFKEELGSLGFATLRSTTHIIPCVLGKESSALALSGFLRKAGILVPAIRPPTVPANTARLRFSLHCGITDNQLNDVIAAIKEWKNINGT